MRKNFGKALQVRSIWLILWGAKKPIILLTDNKTFSRFFKAKHIISSPGNFCDQILKFNFRLTHIPVVKNPAADYLSRLEIRPEEKVKGLTQGKLNDSIPVYHNENDIASKTYKHEEDEPDFFIPGDATRKTRAKDEKKMQILCRN